MSFSTSLLCILYNPTLNPQKGMGCAHAVQDKIGLQSGGLNDNGPPRFKYWSAWSHLVELFGKDKGLGLIGGAGSLEVAGGAVPS